MHPKTKADYQKKHVRRSAARFRKLRAIPIVDRATRPRTVSPEDAAVNRQMLFELFAGEAPVARRKTYVLQVRKKHVKGRVVLGNPKTGRARVFRTPREAKHTQESFEDLLARMRKNAEAK